MRAIRCLLAAVLAAGIVTVVAAQPGRGGFGGQNQDVYVLVLTNTALQEDLKVTDAQKTKLKPAAEKETELTKKRTELFSKGFKGIDKDKVAELTEEGKKVNEEVRKIVDDTLTADQKKRLHQIAIQAMSFTVFNDPEAKGGGKGGGGGGGFGGFGVTEAQKSIMKEVGEALKLSDSQKSTIKGLVDDFNKESREIRTEAGIGGGGGGKGKGKGGGGGGKAPDQEKVDAANKKIDKLRKETWAKVEEGLDGTQKTAWKGLVGEAFDTAKLRPAPMRKD